MADVFDKQKRSEVMSCIKGSGNKDTELALIKLFRYYKISGWRRHQNVYGKPDFVFPSRKVAIFVDGCFWHCCKKHYRLPASNQEFWKKKMDANVKRDRLVNKTLRKNGWLVVRIWEHDLKYPKRIIPRILCAIK